MSALETEAALPIAGTRLRWVADLPASLPDATRLGRDVQARPGELLIGFPELARYHVGHGRLIDVALLPGGTRHEAMFFLMATPFGALIHQRGELPMHAAAVVPPGGSRALLIAGGSGAGKSTTSAALAQRGWTVLCDDVSRVNMADGEVRVWPGFARLKLWRQSCDLLGLDSTGLPRTNGTKEKYFWQPAGAPPVAHPRGVPIAAVVELAGTEPGVDAGTLVRQRGGAAMRLLVRQTFRPRLIAPLGCQRSHFAQLGHAVGAVACHRVGNSHGLPPDALADRLRALPDE